MINEKFKSKKRFNFHKKAKICTSTNSPVCTNSNVLCKEGILQLRQLIKFLVLEQSKKIFLFTFLNICNITDDLDITQEGIFRRTGSLARQNDLKSKINNGLPLNLEGGSYTVHDCASVFKGILSELPEPLLTDTYNIAHIQIAGLKQNQNYLLPLLTFSNISYRALQQFRQFERNPSCSFTSTFAAVTTERKLRPFKRHYRNA